MSTFSRMRGFCTRLHSASLVSVLLASLLPVASASAAPDLAVSSIDASALAWDCSSGDVSGPIELTLRNDGHGAVGEPYKILAFEDADGDHLYSPNSDTVLGEINGPPLAAGSSATATIATSGTTSFRGKPICVLLDSRSDVPEEIETNNLATTGWDAVFEPEPAAFSLALKYESLDSEDLYVFSTPIVGRVADTNGDAKVDWRDVPCIVVQGSETTNCTTGEVYVLRGDTGAVVWQSDTDGEIGCSDLAIGDIDGDGLPEVVAASLSYDKLWAFEHDGTSKWSPARAYSGPINSGPAAVLIAELDGVGRPEIVIGAQIFSSDGYLIADAGTSGPDGLNGNYVSSVAADIDADGVVELIVGGSVYSFVRSPGELQSHLELEGAFALDGAAAVADLDLDGDGEIVVMQGGVLHAIETSTWSEMDGWPVSIDPPYCQGGIPTIANFDADAEPEIAMSCKAIFKVLDPDGTVLWDEEIQDITSSICGVSAFDFDGDGVNEVLHRDELKMFVRDGATGAELASVEAGSGTGIEAPIVADVDGDGRAEIVLSGSHEGNPPGVVRCLGVRVYENDAQWATARPVWNQNSYHVTNVADDLTLPRHERANWPPAPGAAGNTFKAQVHLEAGAFAAPNLTASLITQDLDCEEGGTLTVRVGNAGAIAVPAGVLVSFYVNEADPANLLGTEATTEALLPGFFEDVPLDLEDAPTARTIVAMVDDDGEEIGAVAESSETDNACETTLSLPCTGTVLEAKETVLELSGEVAGNHHDPVLLRGTLTDEATSDPIGGVFVTFSLDAQTCRALTAPITGEASCWVTVQSPFGTAASVGAVSDAGSRWMSASAGPEIFTIGREELSVLLDGPWVQPSPDGTLAASAWVRENGALGLDERTVTLIAGAVSADPPPETDAEGFAEAGLEDVGWGTFELTATVAQTDTHVTDSDSIFVHLLPRQLRLMPLSQVVTLGSEATVTATVLDDGSDRENVPVRFMLVAAESANEPDAETNDLGVATWHYEGEDAGHDTVLAFIDRNADGDLDAGEPSAQASVQHQLLRVTDLELISGGSGQYLDPVEVKVKLTETISGSPVAVTDAVLELVVSGNTYRAPTDGSGIAHFWIAPDVAPTTLSMEASYSGSATRADHTESFNFVLSKEPPVVRILAIRQDGSGKAKVKILLRDDDAVPLSGHVVTISRTGVAGSFNVTTGSDGMAEAFQIPVADGTVQFQAQHAETTCRYDSASATPRSVTVSHGTFTSFIEQSASIGAIEAVTADRFGDSTLLVGWDDTIQFIGEGAVAGYRITVTGTGWTRTAATIMKTPLSHPVIDVPNGVVASVVVTPVGYIAEGPASSPAVTETTYAPPSAPTDVEATSDANSIELTWDVPADLGGDTVDHYVVVSEPNGTVTDPATSGLDVTGVAPGELRTFRVLAVTDEGGEGVLSAPIELIAPRSAPSDPPHIVLDPTTQRLYWWQPEDANGSAITKYVVKEGAATVDANVGATKAYLDVAATATIGSATSYTVEAVNGVGSSEPVASPEVTPFDPPGTPTGVTPTPLNGAIEIAWSAPSPNGSAISGYLGRADTTRGPALASARIITGLTNGTEYDPTGVKAFNRAGPGGEGTDDAVTPAREPEAPTITSVEAALGLVTIHWDPPTGGDTGGSEIIGCVVTALPEIDPVSCPCGDPCDVTGLTPGQEYVFFVRAENEVGLGAESLASESVVPCGPPSVPRGLTASIAGDLRIRVTWIPPEDDGGLPITGYTIDSAGVDQPCNAIATARSCIFDQLEGGVVLTFTATATSDCDTSDAAETTITVASLPLMPDDVAATVSDSSAHVTWDALAVGEDSGWDDLISYKVCPMPADADCVDVPAAATEADLTDLENGTTYVFNVQGRNSVGLGEPGVSDEATPCGLPTAPLDVRAHVSGNGQLTVTWGPPAFDGGCGDTLTYEVLADDTLPWKPPTGARLLAVGSLAVGQPHHFLVRATNSVGTGPESRVSADVVAAEPPSAPLSPVWQPGDGVGRACWVTPEDDGGSAITHYDLVVVPGPIPGDVDAPATCVVIPVECPDDYTFTLTATNAAGTSSVSVESEAQGDCGPPTEVAIVLPAAVAVGQTVTGFIFLDNLTGTGGEDVTIAATDGTLLTCVATVVVAEHENTASFEITGVEAGSETLTATFGAATDDGPIEVTEDDETGAGDGPYVKIESPDDGDEVTHFATDVEITVQGDVVSAWTLSWRPADGTESEWVELATGSSTVSHSAVAQLDPTLMLNGQIELLLEATDANGSKSDQVFAVVSGQQKIGNFTVSFVDMTIPISGLPIQVVRTYDSRNKRQGDFGVGWSLSFNSIKLEITRPLGIAWRKADYSNPLFPYTPRFCNEETAPHVVTVTFPDGKVEQFKPILETARNNGAPCSLLGTDHGWVRFVPTTPRTYSKLAFAGGDDAAEADLDATNENLWQGHGLYEDVFDATSYVLTTQDGIEYTFDRTAVGPPQRFALTRMEDRNGNAVNFTATSITAEPSGHEVIINREAGEGFINTICDPLNHCVSYEYTQANFAPTGPADYRYLLQKYRDRTQQTGWGAPFTGFTYHEELPHLLETIDDPLGNRGTWTGYDEDGRLDRICGPLAANLEDDENCITLASPTLGVSQTIEDRRGNVTLLEFDDRGNVTRKLDAVGQEWLYPVITADDQVALEVDPLGHETEYTFDEGRQATVTVHPETGLELTTTYVWSEAGELEEVIQPGDGGSSTYIYNDDGNLIGERGPDNKGSDYVPDSQGNIVQVTDALQNVVSTSQWSGGLVRVEMSASGLTTTYDYIVNPEAVPWEQVEDPNGNPQSVTTCDLDGEVIATTLHQYDLEGRLTRTDQPDGGATETDYDAAGRPWKQRLLVDLGEDLEDPDDDYWRETVTWYDEAGRVRWIQHQDETFEEFRYDLDGNRTWRRGRTAYTSWTDNPMPGNGPTFDDESLSVITQTAYDGLNRAVKTCVGKDPELLDPVLAWEEGCTWSHYDIAGRSTWRLDQRGAISVTEYDLANRVEKRCGPWFIDPVPDMDDEVTCDGQDDTWVTEYDTSGRAFRTVEPGTGVFTTSVYDAHGTTVASCRSLAALSSGFDAEDARDAQQDHEDDITCKVMEHDDLGRVIAEIDRSGDRTEFAFDAAGNLESVTDALEHVTSYVHDEHGNMTEQHDALERVTLFEYEHGRRTARRLPLGQRESFEHSVGGFIRARTDFERRRTVYVEDFTTGRTIGRDFPTDSDVSLSPYVDGPYHQVTDARETVTNVRDPATGRLMRVNHPANTDLAYTHDDAGNRESTMTDPDGAPRVTAYAHDAAGRLLTVSDAAGGAVYGYDEAGRLEEIDYVLSGVHRVRGAYTYDAVTGGLSRISWTTLTHVPPAGPAVGSPLLDLTYGLDEEGRRLGVCEVRAGGVSRLVRWGFDETSRLTRELACSGATAPCDPLVDFASIPIDCEMEFDTAYEYDALGNRLAKQVMRPGEPAELETSSYDDNDRLANLGNSWDANGNTVGREGRVYAWNESDRLIGVDDDWGFEYDANGLKQATSSPSAVVEHVIDESFPYAQVIEDRDAAGDATLTILRGHHPLRLVTTSGSWWYLHDALGSTRALISLDGGTATTDEWDYEAFGKVVQYDAPAGALEAAGAANRWMFAGEERSGTVGLDYLRARWVTNEGRFLSPDPAWLLQLQQNKPVFASYVYASNAPTQFIDPSGEMSIIEVAGAAALGMALSTMGATSTSSLSTVSWTWHVEPIILEGSKWTDAEVSYQLAIAQRVLQEQANVRLYWHFPKHATFDGMLEWDESDLYYVDRWSPFIDVRGPVLIFADSIANEPQFAGVSYFRGFTDSSVSVVVDGSAATVTAHELCHAVGNLADRGMDPSLLMHHQAAGGELLTESERNWLGAIRRGAPGWP
jgi:RHS repeat-associated protein